MSHAERAEPFTLDSALGGNVRCEESNKKKEKKEVFLDMVETLPCSCRGWRKHVKGLTGGQEVYILIGWETWEGGLRLERAKKR